ncbi:ATP-dependent DNA helicase [Trichonephila clavipes]|nr:ATP-dependent DNA helicase [Trichonephila clavipes]
METSSSSVIPTHLAHADNQADGHPRETPLQIVYGLDKTHSQQFVYVALTLETSIEGLYIGTSNNKSTFYHEDMTNFISVRRGLSLFSLNCQSLSAPVADFTDTITQQSNVLLFSETWLKNEDSFDIPNYDCVCHFKRPHVRTGGVAIYQNSNDVTHVITPYKDLMMRQTASLAVKVSHGEKRFTQK